MYSVLVPQQSCAVRPRLSPQPVGNLFITLTGDLTLIQLVGVIAPAVPLIHPITAAAILISLQRLRCCGERNDTRKCLCTGQRSQNTGVKLGAAPESIWRRDKCSDCVRCERETRHKTTQPLTAAVPHRYCPPVTTESSP